MDIFPDWLGQYGSSDVGIAGYRTVTGPIKDIQGDNLTSGTLQIRMLSPTVDGNIFIAPVTMNEPIVNGYVSIPLVAPAQYGFLVINEYGETIWNFQAYLSDESEAAISLAELYLSQEDTQQDLSVVPRTFIGLLDTPNSLLGSGGQLLTVGDDEAGVQTSEKILWGTGNPEGVVVADVGTIFIREDGGPGTTMYLKESGDGTANGWTAK